MTKRELPKVSGLVGAPPHVGKGSPAGALFLGSFEAPQKKTGVMLAQDRNSPRLARIDLTLIDESPEQNRLVYDEESLLSLGDTLKVHQVEPIVLRQKSGGRFEVRSGHRRRRAALMVGMVDLLALIYSEDADVDNDQIGLDILISNEQRESLSDFERALGYKHKLEQTKITQAELARRLGLDRSLITKRMGFFKLPETVQNALLKNPRSFSHRFLPDMLEALERKPDLDQVLVNGIVSIGAGETGPESVVRTLTRLSHQSSPEEQAKNLQKKRMERTVSIEGGRHVCTLRLPTDADRGFVIKPAKGVDVEAFAAAMSDLIEKNKAVFESTFERGSD